MEWNLVENYIREKDERYIQEAIDEFIKEWHLEFMSEETKPWLRRYADDALEELLEKAHEEYLNGGDAESIADIDYYAKYLDGQYAEGTIGDHFGNTPLDTAKKLLNNSKYKNFDIISENIVDSINGSDQIDFLKYVNESNVDDLAELLSDYANVYLSEKPNKISDDVLKVIANTSFKTTMIYHNFSMGDIARKVEFKPGDEILASVLIDVLQLTDEFAGNDNPNEIIATIQNKLEIYDGDEWLERNFKRFKGEIVSTTTIK